MNTLQNKICRIGFTSTQSCGKSTLVKALAELPEFTNFHISTERSKYLRDLGIKLNGSSDVYGQVIFLSERLNELQNDLLISDRSILDVMSFTSLSTEISEQDKNRFEVFAAPFIKQYDYIFYISPDGMDLEDNSVRDTDPEFRAAVDNKIKHYLDYYGFNIKNFKQISGTVEERIAEVLQTVKF